MYKKGNHKLLALSLLLAVVFATSFFLLPRPSVVYAASNDAISYDSATKTVTIQGNCTTDEIYSFMHAQGEGVSATTLHFAGTSVIQTLQYDPDSGSSPDSSKGPFASTQLVSIEADPDAHVLFTGKNENTSPVLTAFFANCSSLSSLDGLSAWNVGNVSGNYCMNWMFKGCTNLTSLDAIASWNIDKAINSSHGVIGMFSDCKNIASITLGGADGFKLCNNFENDMSLPSANWWPVDDTSASAKAINTATLVSQSKDPSTLASLRWQRCADGSSANPMQTVDSLNVVWPQTTADKKELIYNGLFQTLGTEDDKVQVTATIKGQTDSVTLTEGTDFNVVYKDAAGTDTTAIKDAGNYSARIVLRGAYIGQDSDTVEVTIKQLDLASDAYSLVSYTLPSRFPYTGNAHTPKTMVRLYLRDDPNPASTPEKPLPDIPIYTYLIQYSSERTIGDYSVSYANNTDPGTATATLSPAIPEGRAQSNLTNTTNAYFAIGDYFVTFDSCGGTPVPEQGTVNGLLTKPKDPTKEGYIFDGWYTEDSYIHKWDFATDTLSSNITLYAKWEVAPEPGPSPDPEPTPGTQDGWVQSDAGWQYVLNGEFLNDGWHYFEDEYGNHWYYFDSDTYMATSRWIWDDEWEGWYWVCSTGPMIENLWQWIDNAWYGFWWGGKMCQGWVWDTYYNAWYYCDDYTGRVACNEWAWDGAWYYFDQNCQMLTNCWVGSYWLNASGQWV